MRKRKTTFRGDLLKNKCTKSTCRELMNSLFYFYWKVQSLILLINFKINSFPNCLIVFVNFLLFVCCYLIFVYFSHRIRSDAKQGESKAEYRTCSKTKTSWFEVIKRRATWPAAAARRAKPPTVKACVVSRLAAVKEFPDFTNYAK